MADEFDFDKLLDDSASAFEKIKTGLNTYVVTPANKFGLGGFNFDLEERTTLTSGSQITDNYVEDNSAIQDHIALQPIKVTLRSLAGELVYSPNDGVEEFIEKVTQKLTVIDSYLPKLSDAEQQIRDIAENTENVEDLLDQTDNISNLWSLSKNLLNATGRQQEVYRYLQTLRKQKILTSVQTPYEYLENMAIETLTATQDPETRSISTFTVTLKQVRKASVTYTTFNSEDYQSRTAVQTEPKDIQGKVQGGESALSKLFGGAGEIVDKVSDAVGDII